MRSESPTYRAIALLVLFVMTLGTLAGCVQAPAAPAPAAPAEPAKAAAPAAPAAPAASGEKIKIPVEMSVYVEAPHKKAFDMLKEAYEKQNPNIEIEYYGAPYNDFWPKLTTEVMAGTEACIVQLQGGNTKYATYAALRPGETGAFVNLDPYIKGTHWEDDLITQKDMTYNGHYIGMSNYAWGARGLYYRKSLLDAAGIKPEDIKTIDDFRNAAIKLTKKGEGGKPDQYGFGAVLSSHSFVFDEMKTFIERPASQGIFFPEEKAPYTSDRVSVNSPANVWAWQWWQNLILKDKVSPTGYDKAAQREQFWNGTQAMEIDGPWFVGMTREKDAKLIDDLGVMASPDVVYEGKTYPFNLETYAITHLISNKCAHPEEAWKFLEWMAGPEGQQIVAVSGMIPANLKFATSDAYKKSEPLNAQLVDLVQKRYKLDGQIDPNIPQAGAMTDIMVQAAQEAFINGADVKATLDKAAEQMKKELSK
jgi:multiple sugar transport system substrate-binding protein